MGLPGQAAVALESAFGRKGNGPDAVVIEVVERRDAEAVLDESPEPESPDGPVGQAQGRAQAPAVRGGAAGAHPFVKERSTERGRRLDSFAFPLGAHRRHASDAAGQGTGGEGRPKMGQAEVFCGTEAEHAALQRKAVLEDAAEGQVLLGVAVVHGFGIGRIRVGETGPGIGIAPGGAQFPAAVFAGIGAAEGCVPLPEPLRRAPGIIDDGTRQTAVGQKAVCRYAQRSAFPGVSRQLQRRTGGGDIAAFSPLDFFRSVLEAARTEGIVSAARQITARGGQTPAGRNPAVHADRGLEGQEGTAGERGLHPDGGHAEIRHLAFQGEQAAGGERGRRTEDVVRRADVHPDAFGLVEVEAGEVDAAVLAVAEKDPVQADRRVRRAKAPDRYGFQSADPSVILDLEAGQRAERFMEIPGARAFDVGGGNPPGGRAAVQDGPSFPPVNGAGRDERIPKVRHGRVCRMLQTKIEQ